MEKTKIYFFILLILSLLVTNDLMAQTTPQSLNNVKIQARVTLDEYSIYHYYHIVTNPAENKIGIGDIDIDITVPNYGGSTDSIWLEGYDMPDYFTPKQAEKRGMRYVNVAWKTTSLWKGFVGLQDGRWSLLGDTAIIGRRAIYNFDTNYQYLLNPGETSSELEIISYGLPSIRKVVFKPDYTELSLPSDWFLNEEDDANAFITNNRKKESLGCLGTTIGPAAPPTYNPLQFNQLMLDYVTQSVNLGWLKDNTLTQQLNNYLTQNAAALQEKRYMDAQNIVTQFMNAMQNSGITQRTNEAYALLYYNAQYFYDRITEDLPETIEISPAVSEHNLNDTHTTQVRVRQGYDPSQDYYLTARVISGPHTGLVWRGKTDEGGNWTFSYKGEKLGTDLIQFVNEATQIVSSDVILWQPSQGPKSQPIKVTWKGGPDLMLNKFFPPMIKIPFARATIPLEESTINVGNVPAPASTTRYYITKTGQISPDDKVIGERKVPPLAVKEISEYKAEIPVPSNLEAGTYYIYGCADADNEIIELDETNNCRTLMVNVYMPVEKSANRAPVCSLAKASPNNLWPPNHKYQSIKITGVTDPDNDKINLSIKYITQNEPVNGLGDGDTSPDATINPLQVRAERSGTGNGRVYHIGFSAEDGKGGKCEGEVVVCVPHDQGQGKVCIDNGPKYDSTKP